MLFCISGRTRGKVKAATLRQLPQPEPSKRAKAEKDRPPSLHYTSPESLKYIKEHDADERAREELEWQKAIAAEEERMEKEEEEWEKAIQVEEDRMAREAEQDVKAAGEPGGPGPTDVKVEPPQEPPATGGGGDPSAGPTENPTEKSVNFKTTEVT